MTDEAAEAAEDAQVLSIEFILSSGETLTVREFAGESSLEAAMNRLGQQLAQEIGGDRTRTFSYWEGDDYYFDAVAMRHVIAFSISSYLADDLDDDDELDDEV